MRGLFARAGSASSPSISRGWCLTSRSRSRLMPGVERQHLGARPGGDRAGQERLLPCPGQGDNGRARTHDL